MVFSSSAASLASSLEVSKEVAQMSSRQSRGECLTLATEVSFSSRCRSLFNRPTARAGSSTCVEQSASAADTLDKPSKAICSIRPWLQLSATFFSSPTLHTSLHTEDTTEVELSTTGNWEWKKLLWGYLARQDSRTTSVSASSPPPQPPRTR